MWLFGVVYDVLFLGVLLEIYVVIGLEWLWIVVDVGGVVVCSDLMIWVYLMVVGFV